jgi:tRNA(fMet)-specific endonuclease VapC
MSKDSYLLDNNIFSALCDGLSSNHEKAKLFLQQVGQNYVFVPCVAIAEIRYGNEVVFKKDKKRQNEIEKRIKSLSDKSIKNITKHTTTRYSQIRAELFRKYGTRTARQTIKEKHPEDLMDISTAKSLGIDENDLWICSLAIEFNLVLVTKDNMTRLEEIAMKVAKEIAPNFRFERWL